MYNSGQTNDSFYSNENQMQSTADNQIVNVERRHGQIKDLEVGDDVSRCERETCISFSRRPTLFICTKSIVTLPNSCKAMIRSSVGMNSSDAPDLFSPSDNIELSVAQTETKVFTGTKALAASVDLQVGKSSVHRRPSVTRPFLSAVSHPSEEDPMRSADICCLGYHHHHCRGHCCD